MNKQTRPHVSKAILHLRRSISVVALVLALALVGQVLGWAIVHFTEARFADLKAAAVEEMAEQPHDPVVVVNTETSGAKPADAASLIAMAEGEQGAEVNRVEGRGAVMLAGFLNLTQTVGIIMSITLVILMLQGVAVAGGASIPGVEMAVTATTWSIIVALLCVPLSGLIPDARFPGVFCSYLTIAQASEAYSAGAPGAPGFVGFWLRFAALPLVLVVGLTAMVLRFRAGVNAGIIITNVSELEERLEREIRARRVGELSTPRAVGALNHVIGETGLSAPPMANYDTHTTSLRPTGTDPESSSTGPQRRIRPI